MTGAINLALRPDVYCIISQSLEVLSANSVEFSSELNGTLLP